MNGILFVLYAFVAISDGCTYLHVWPLGRGSGGYDVITNTSDAEVGSAVQHLDNVIRLGYETLQFTRSEKSYVDVRIHAPDPTAYPEATSTSGGPGNDFDYSFGFHFLLDETSGVLFEYLAENRNFDASVIEHFRVEVNNGTLRFTSQSVVDYNITTVFEINTWYYIWVENDENSDIFKFYDESGSEMSENAIFSGTKKDFKTKFPGTLRFGNSLNGTGTPLHGSIACVQFQPCKIQVVAPYTCADLSVTTPSTTSTTVATTTTTAADIMPTTATSTTVAATIPTSAIATSTAAMMPTTSTATTVATTSTTNTFGTSDGAYENIFTRFRLLSYDTAFASATHVIQSHLVEESRRCAVLCIQNDGCALYAVSPTSAGRKLCHLGVLTTAFTPSLGSTMYILD